MKRSKIRINKRKLRKLTLSKNHFASLTESIIFQQLSGKAAGTILKRFLDLFPKKAKGFPSPEALLKMPIEKLRSAGLSGQKISYVRDLAGKFLNKTISSHKFPKMTDMEIRTHLVAVKGIGVWTADMFLMFALNRPNVLPVGDLAIRKGFQKLWKLRTMPDEKKMRILAKEFDGHHTELSLYLWHIMDGEK